MRRAAVGVARRAAADAPRRRDRRRQLGHRARRRCSPAAALEVQLGTPHRRAGRRELARRRARTSATCPACALPETVARPPAAEIELAGARPRLPRRPRRARCPRRVGAIGDRGRARAPACCVAHQGPGRRRSGTLPDASTSPSACRARAVACLGGPAHAARGARARRRARGRSAPPTPTCAASSARCFDARRPRLRALRRRRPGSRWPAPPRTPPRWPPPPPRRTGLNAAGAAAGRSWREVERLRAPPRRASSRRSPAWPGTGDLTATVMAPTAAATAAPASCSAPGVPGRGDPADRSARPRRRSTRCRCSPSVAARRGPRRPRASTAWPR